MRSRKPEGAPLSALGGLWKTWAIWALGTSWRRKSKTLQDGAPSDVCGFINHEISPINYSYIYHKTTEIRQLSYLGGPILCGFWRFRTPVLDLRSLGDDFQRSATVSDSQPYFHGPSGDARGSKKLQLTGATRGAGMDLAQFTPMKCVAKNWGNARSRAKEFRLGEAFFWLEKIRWWQTGRPPMNSLAARMCLKDDWLSVFGIPLVIVPWKKRGLLTFQSANFNCHWKIMVSWMYVWNTFYWLMDVDGFITCHGPHPIWADPRNGQKPHVGHDFHIYDVPQPHHAHLARPWL